MSREKECLDPCSLTVDQAVELLNPDRKPRAYIYEQRGAWIKVKDILLRKVKDKRKECHDWFDKLWRNGKERDMLYGKLANALGITKEQCHFATLSEEQLDKVLSLLKTWWREKYDR